MSGLVSFCPVCVRGYANVGVLSGGVVVFVEAGVVAATPIAVLLGASATTLVLILPGVSLATPPLVLLGASSISPSLVR